MADKKETTKKTVEKKKSIKIDPAKVTPEVLVQLRAELKQARVDLMSGKSKDLTVIRKTKKNIARAMTFLNQKQEETNAKTN